MEWEGIYDVWSEEVYRRECAMSEDLLRVRSRFAPLRRVADLEPFVALLLRRASWQARTRAGG